MSEKILILSMYPAPYRVELFEEFKNFDADVFFESSNGDERSEEWFLKGEYKLIDTYDGKKAYKESIKNLKEYSLVAIYEYSTKTGIKLILNCMRKHIPYVVNSDGVMMTEHSNFIKKIIKKFLLKKASAYLASGENAKQYFINYGANEKNIYIHNFSTLHKKDILDNSVSYEEKIKLRKKLGLDTNCKIAIAVGRFIPLKRYNELIEAWKIMPENYKLLLIGGGREKEKYEATIKNNGLKNVIIESFYPKEELFEYYKASDVFIHPTSYDVWGLVVNEAMACGLPVVVSDHCVAGLELVKSGENGFLVKMGDDEKMCRKVIDICSEEQSYQQFSENAIKTIRPYTIENMAEVHKNLFESLI